MNGEMATDQKPVKGILKNSSSFDQDGGNEAKREKREMKFDEMNILATYHPPDKDYGHKKIDEPPTPYSKLSEEELDHSGGEDEEEVLDPQDLTTKLEGSIEVAKEKKKIVLSSPDNSDSEDETADETADERAKRKSFEQKRKLHYNEFHAIKLARNLMSDEDEEEKEEEDKDDVASTSK